MRVMNLASFFQYLAFMSRKPLIRSQEFPYHVTARANNREIFPLPLEQVWTTLCKEVVFSRYHFAIEVQALVLMPNHFHMILTTPEQDIGVVMESFMKNITLFLNLKSGRSGRIFGGPYYPSIIQSDLYFSQAYKYVYRNPIKAGIVRRVEDYSFSTLPGLLGLAHLPFPLHLPRSGSGLFLFDKTHDEHLDWLNSQTRKELDDAIRRGLKRTVFKIPVSQSSRRKEKLDLPK